MSRFNFDRNPLSLLLTTWTDSGGYMRQALRVGDGRPGGSYSLAVKRPLEVSLSVVLIVLATPLLLALVLLTRWDGGSSFYGHLRTGRQGRDFRCLKFRSMRVDADHALESHLADNPEARREWETHRKLRNDPRVTRLGRFMRKTSLDELPQLFNVISGEMSLIGPRPVVKSELASYYNPEAREAYCSVRPGITGLWQVSGRSDVSYDQRVELDVRYARNISFKSDCTILWRTASVVAFGRGAR